MARRNGYKRIAELICGGRKQWRGLPQEERQAVLDTARDMYDRGINFSTAEKAEQTDLRGFVYVIVNPAWEDYCKIGRAFDPESRLRGYQTSSPFRDYELHGSRYFNNAAIAEQEIHLRLSRFREEGEWFYMDPELALVEIDKLQEQML